MTFTIPTTGLQLRSIITSQGELELTIIDEPVLAPGSDEVLIRVEATPINPSDQGLLFGAADLSTLSAGGTAARPIMERTKIEQQNFSLIAGLPVKYRDS